MGHNNTVTQVTLGQECWVGRQMDVLGGEL